MPATPRRRKGLAIALSLLISTFGLLWWIGVIGGNVHEVASGRFYRSAQLTDATLSNTLRRFHIASVVNLRGAYPDQQFYTSELRVCRELGVRHEDVSFSAVRLPPPTELEKLLRCFDTMPRPVLIHCQAGSDRTGLAATLYVNLYEGVPLDRAEASQLTWRYGHFSFSRTRAMDRFFDLYRKTSQGLGMRAWIGTKYPALYQDLAKRKDSAIRPEDTRA